MRKDTFFEELDVPLTESERLQRSEALAKQLQARETLEKEKKDANARFKERKDALDADIEKIARTVRTKKEPRSVECREEYGGGQTMEIIRLDGHEPRVVRTRGMTEKEIRDRQQFKLFDINGGKKPKPDTTAKEEPKDGSLKVDDNGLAKGPVTTSLGDKLVAAGGAVNDAAAEGAALKDVVREMGEGAEGEPARSTDPATGQELVQVKAGRGARRKKGETAPAGEPSTAPKRSRRKASPAAPPEEAQEGLQDAPAVAAGAEGASA